MRSKKHSAIFRSFLLSYICILLIPACSGIISYYVAIGVIESNAEESSLILLTQSRDIIDQSMKGIEGFVKELSFNEHLNYLMSVKKEKGAPHTYRAWKAWRSVIPYSLINSELRDFYIYLKDINLIITPSTPYVRPDDYFEISYYPDLEMDVWKKDVLSDTRILVGCRIV